MEENPAAYFNPIKASRIQFGLSHMCVCEYTYSCVT